MAVSYLEPDQARFYAGLVLRALTDTSRRTLKGIMTTAKYDYWAELADEKIQEGRIEGWAKGLLEGRLTTAAGAILTVLGARGLDVPAAVRERIEETHDLDQLTTWLRRAATVDHADDLIA